ncbi:cytochrome c oxidase accessory protein CcoG, partial [Pseudomonas aeruginosa]
MSKQIPVQDVTPPAKGDTNNNDLYAKREKIYTRAFTGIFRRLRMVGGAALFLLYFG